MAVVCAQCSRVNPTDAAYCYHDGAALAGRVGGPVNPGSAPFPNPFVFPNGQACRNFDQLAMSCQQNWSASVDLLQQGFLASFFGGLGRADLAVAAQEAAKFPDPDRGLDQLLAKLPSQVLEPPRLQAEPGEVSLGRLPVGADRTLELHLTNLGMRLLYGSVASDCKWLKLGDPPGQSQKVFQFGDEAVIAVQVRGHYLRAGRRPLEGRLVIDSNGGTATVTVRADVPVTPFAGGLFDGATTPRQVAEKSKANPKDAAPYFEDGRVAAWFQANGWTYPVQGPPMSGMGAVQQFFEALGVAKAPRVEVSPPVIELRGAPGEVFERSLEISSPERKVVYGWATADCRWVAVGPTRLSGRAATIPLTVTVPGGAGTRQARLTVVGNGQQRFTVPLALTVVGGTEVLDAELVEWSTDIEAMDGSTELSLPAAPPGRNPEPTAVAAAAVKTPVAVAAPVRASGAPETTVTFAPGLPAAAPAGRAEPVLAVGHADSLIDRPAVLGPLRPARRHLWVHLVPLGLLGLALFVTLVRDVAYSLFFHRADTAVTDVDTRRLLQLMFDWNSDPKKVDKQITNSAMSGLIYHDPVHGEKKLIYGRYGHTNSVVLKIDGKDRVFGKQGGGRWAVRPEGIRLADGKPYPYPGKLCSYEFLPERVVVSQEVKLIPGEPVEVSPGVYKRLLDTCLFRYKVENQDSQARDVGLRFLLDTYIGANDGVPFTLPGVNDLVDTTAELKAEQVPDFIQVLERPDLKNPGVIAQLDLRLGQHEAPGRVKLTAHPQSQLKEGVSKETWEVPLESIKEAQDSCVVLYWEPVLLDRGKFRDLAFTYGLGNVAIGPEAKLGLTVGGATVVGGELSVVALVADPQPDQTIELQLPPGLELAKDSPMVQRVPPSVEKTKDGKTVPSPVTWHVRATGEGRFSIAVETRAGGEAVTQSRQVTITRAKLF
jgi:hypothetical protein